MADALDKNKDNEVPLEKKLDDPALHGLLYNIAFLQNDNATMHRISESARGKAWEDLALSSDAGVAANHGRG